MDKVRSFGRNLSLRKSLVLYVAVFVILALVLSVTTASLCSVKINAVKASYPVNGEKYYLQNEQGERLGNGNFISDESVPLTEYDERTIEILELIPLITTPLYSTLCIIAASLLFYRNRLRKPLSRY